MTDSRSEKASQRRRPAYLCLGLAIVFLAAPTPSSAQSAEQAGQTAETGAGEVGVRQNARTNATKIEPQARITNRIENRLDSRINNRLGRGYDRNANATSQFNRADAQSRSLGRRKGPTQNSIKRHPISGRETLKSPDWRKVDPKD